MDNTAAVPVPNPFMPHSNFSDEVNRNIVQSEIEGGVYLDELCEGAVLEVETQHHGYTIVIRGRGRDLISGPPKYCPEDRKSTRLNSSHATLSRMPSSA